MKIEVNKLKKNPEAFKNIFKVTEANTLVTQDIYLMFPLHFIKKGLAYINSDGLRIVGIYALLDMDDNYCIVKDPIFQELQPSNISYCEVNGEEYVIAFFNKDTIFMLNNNLVVSDSFLYDLFDEFFTNGKIPWYINYEELANLFSDSKQYTNTNIGSDPIIFEVLTSTIARTKKDKTIYYRKSLNSELSYIGLNDIRYGYNNTGARLIGGYFKEGIINSIVDPETTTSESSKILRK